MRYLLALLLPGILVFAGLQAFSKTNSNSPWEDNSCGFVQNIYNKRLSWQGNLPIKLHIHESVPQNMRAPIQRAMDTWEKTTGKKLFVIVEENKTGPKGIKNFKDGTNTIYWFNRGNGLVTMMIRPKL